MKRQIAAILALSLILAAPAWARSGGSHSGGKSGSHSSRSSGSGEHYVSGHTTKTGKYVAPHYATNPNKIRNDNYSTKGNVNPHTGKAGTKPRDGEG